MTIRDRVRKGWDRNPTSAEVRILALMGLAGSASCVLAAIFPATPEAPTRLLAILGAVGLPVSAGFLWFGQRLPSWSPQLLVAGYTLGISLLISQSATGVGMVVTASAYLWLCVYAAFFFSAGAVRAHMALIAIAFGAALLVGDHGVPIDGWIFITISLVVASETLGSLSSRLRREAQTDALTGLLNRKGLAPAAERAFAIADRTDLPLTVALIDLDHFKQINDRHGHPAGDRVLIDLTRTWSAELEASDIFARLGGDEFLLVLVSSSVEQSKRLLERLRFVSPTAWTAGVAVRKRGESLGSCLAKTDAALYEAKRARTSGAEPADPLPATGVMN